MLGGFSPDNDFPFCSIILETDEAFKSVSEAMNPKIAKKYEKDFRSGYEKHSLALRLIKERFFFYLKLIKKDQNVIKKYNDKIAGLWLTERIIYAMHGCISKSEEILDEIDEFVDGFPAFCKNEEKKTYNFPKEPHTDCERIGICICSLGQEKPYMYGCIVNDPTMLPRDEETSMKRFRKGASLVTKMLLEREG